MDAATFRMHDELERDHWWFRARRRIVGDVVRALVPANDTARILDIGCGTGANLAAFADGYDCLGLDISEDAVALASERYPDLDFRRVDAPEKEADRIADADAILLLDVIEHIDDDAAFLRDVVEAMRPGAKLILTVPARKKLWSAHDKAFGHRRRYETEDLAALLKPLPVKTLLSSPFNARLHPLVAGVRAVGRLLGRSAGKNGTDLSMPPRFVNAALERIFAGESARLLRVLDGAARPYGAGVSLLCAAERIEHVE